MEPIGVNVTADLRQALRDRHPPPEWVMAFEVQAETEEGSLRFADAVAFDTRKGAGMAVHGFELKVSRSDWLNEVREPSKALVARSLCDYWWIVAGSHDIVKPEEVPVGVGLMWPDSGGFQVRLQAKRNDRFAGLLYGQVVVPRALMAAVLRRLDPMEPRAYWEGRERRAEAKGYAKGRNAAGRLARKRDRTGTVEALADGEDFCP